LFVCSFGVLKVTFSSGPICQPCTMGHIQTFSLQYPTVPVPAWFKRQ
jgi:hypothetical protein